MRTDGRKTGLSKSRASIWVGLGDAGADALSACDRHGAARRVRARHQPSRPEYREQGYAARPRAARAACREERSPRAVKRPSEPPARGSQLQSPSPSIPSSTAPSWRCTMAARRRPPIRRACIASWKCRSIIWATSSPIGTSATACRRWPKRASIDAVATWFDERIPEPAAYLAWARTVAEARVRFIVMDFIGAPVDAQTLPAVNAFLGAIGLSMRSEWVAPAADLRVVMQNDAMIGFERKLDGDLPGYMVYRASRSGGSPSRRHRPAGRSQRQGLAPRRHGSGRRLCRLRFHGALRPEDRADVLGSQSL